MLNVQLKGKRTWMQSLLLVMFLLSSTLAFAQNKVTGIVTDKTGAPLPGVNVLEKGTTNGSITDVDGKYSINVEKGKTLMFSYIGFTTREIVVNQNVINVALQEDLQALDEVVVIGYGSMTRKDVTSSITTVKADKLNVGTYTSPAQLLQGKVPGLTITQSSDPNSEYSSITLRGASSLRGGEAMEPYYVVDGVPGVSLALVAPEDIESIDVLRDATATAIYGSKAANGVIIVTTKKGKAGKATVTYSAYIAADKVMKNLDMMTADDLRAYAKANNFTIDNDFGANTDWQKEVQRTAFTHNHNVSISGGSETTSYTASINYMEKQGVIKGTDMDRLIGRAFVQTKALNDRLTLSMNLNASITNNNSVETGGDNTSVYDAMNYYSPLVPVRNEDGSWFKYEGVSQNYNPMSLINEDTYHHQTKKLQGTAKAGLDIMEGLQWNATLSYQNEQFLWDEYHTSQSQLTSVKDNGQAHRRTTMDSKKVFETYLNYDKTFNDIHKLNVMFGYSWEETTKADGYGVTVYDFYNDVLGYKNLGMANKMDGMNGVWSSAENTLRMISFYGRVNYSFNSKYLLQATVRRDGSSAFGVNNRWATFPSFSAAWRISEEEFAKNWSFDDLKLRAGYGVSGNSLGFDPYLPRMVYGGTGWFTYVDSNGNSSEYRTIGALRNSNPDLKWESTSMFNVGVDFSILGSRLGATIEYYVKKTSDLILDYEVSTNRYQYNRMWANVGDITNKGIEVSINAIPVQTKNFVWSTTLNLSHNKNTVDKLSNDTYSVNYINKANPNIGGFSQTNSVQRIMEGEPIGTFYTYHWAGYNEDGVSIFDDYDAEGNLIGTTTNPGEEDRVKVGSAQPKLNLGWNNTLTYKNWTLTAFFQGVFGNKILNLTRAQYNNVTNIKVGKNGLKEIMTDQKPKDGGAQAPSDRYLEDGSYLRLSTLSLGYNFGKIGNWINNLKLTATCNNVFTITGYSGTDPEVSLGGVEPGIDWRNSFYPRTRTFMLGLNVNF
ncbi:TonB-dependent receptor [Bacteroides ndongoniae]|uniref:SusC/RagA family TonB-linked outer membrane protein n=1 Tax=Bacteroides ndongoniae TaxID=1903262 RepID=UPI0023F9BCF6|nr:TonB-dependent receptor [Bacteroides ndongoniae]